MGMGWAFAAGTLSLHTWDPQPILGTGHWGRALARENYFSPLEWMLTILTHFPASSSNVSFCCPEAHG